MLQSALSMFLVSCLLGRLDCTGQTELTVNRGTNATLQCSGHRDADAIMLSWDKRELQSEDYVFYFKDGHIQEEFQHELFKGQVEMKDPDWNKTGDFSVILKNVTTNDAGTYECYAGYEGQKHELLNSLILKVENPGQTGGLREDGGNQGRGNEEKEEGGKTTQTIGLIVGPLVVVVVVAAAAAAVVVVCWWRKKCKNTRTPQNSSQAASPDPHPDDALLADMNSDSHCHAPMKEEQTGLIYRRLQNV